MTKLCFTSWAVRPSLTSEVTNVSLSGIAWPYTVSMPGTSSMLTWMIERPVLGSRRTPSDFTSPTGTPRKVTGAPTRNPATETSKKLTTVKRCSRSMPPPKNSTPGDDQRERSEDERPDERRARPGHGVRPRQELAHLRAFGERASSAGTPSATGRWVSPSRNSMRSAMR